MTRLSYEESCRRLQGKYLDPGAIPPMPNQMPHPDDDGRSGIRFFRTRVGPGDLNGLTLSRTFIGRSEVSGVSFRGTSLSESCLCWNDFNDVDFTDASLDRCDLRASDFGGVKFINADLRQSDLRMSSFRNCDFRDARMDGAILTRRQGEKLPLSEVQRAAISWADDDGDEPDGG